MGAQLVAEAIAYSNLHKEIGYAARCLLVWMALRALDDASGTPERPARLSYMSRSQLGLGMGKFMPDREPSQDAPLEERRQWDADDRAISRALKDLRAANAIAEETRARNGWTATYEITLGRRSASPFRTQNVALRPVFDETVADTERHPSGDAQRHPSGHKTSPKGDAHRRPKEHQDEPDKRDDNFTRASTLGAPVDNSDERRSA